MSVDTVHWQGQQTLNEECTIIVYQPCSLKCIFYISFYMITADELTTIIIYAKINQIEWRRVI